MKCDDYEYCTNHLCNRGFSRCCIDCETKETCIYVCDMSISIIKRRKNKEILEKMGILSKFDNSKVKFRVFDYENMVFLNPENIVIRADGAGVFDRERDVELHNVILLQDTGLKDKNGKEIWTGDIIEVTKNVFVENTIVNHHYSKFEYKKTRIVVEIDTYFNIENIDFKNTEIIGNIYENPELLEEK